MKFKTILIILVFSLNWTNEIKSQNKNDILFITKLKNKTITVRKTHNNKNEYAIYFDTSLIDTIKVLPNYSLYNYNPNIYVFNIYNSITNKNDIYQISINDTPIKHILSTTNKYYGLINSELIGVEQNIKDFVRENEPDGIESGGMKMNEERLTKIISYNLKTNKETLLAHIDSLSLKINSNEDIIDLIISENKVLIALGLYETGEYFYSKYLIYNLSDKSTNIKDYTKNTSLHKNDITFNTVRLFTTRHQIYCKNYIFTNNYLLDKDFNILSPILKKSNSLLYYSMDNALNIIANTDSTKYKWSKDRVKGELIYNVNTYIEAGAYKIFYNEELYTDDIIQILGDEMILLKKMIYAKYNSKFEDKVYQLFYNTFDFYDYRFKYRKTFIDLNPIDKTNLELIQKN